MIHKIGVTGTRSGMDDKQLKEVKKYLEGMIYLLGNIELHHGDCVGVDVEVANIAQQLGCKIVCHPPIKSELRAFHKSDEYRPPYSYFERNRNIVDSCDVLMVVPYQTEHQKNGRTWYIPITWYTHDYAVKKKKPLEIFYSNR